MAGVFCGAIVGCMGYFFKYIKDDDKRKTWKGIWILFWIFVFNTCGLAAKWSNSIYIGTLSLGYTSKRFWGDEKPVALVGTAWDYICVFLFSSVGAMLLVSKISPSLIAASIGIIVPAMIIKMVSCFILAANRGWTVKEKLFVACA